MIKDVFVFKKNAWHMRLMYFIWGYTSHDFRNMCPYFWLSVFNVLVGISIIVPAKYLGKQIYNFIEFVGEFVEAMLSDYKKRCDEADEKFREKVRQDLWNSRIVDEGNGKLKVNTDLDKEDLWEQYYRSRYLYQGNPFYRKMPAKLRDAVGNKLYDKDFFEAFEMLVPKFAKKYQDLHEEWKKNDEARRNAEKAKQVARAKRIGQLTMIFKKFFTVIAALIIVAIVGLVGWGLYELYILLVTRVDWEKVIGFTITATIILAGLAALAGVAWLLFKFVRYMYCRYGEFCIPCMERREKFVNGFLSVLLAIPFLFVNFYPALLHGDNVRPGPIPWCFIQIWKGLVFIYEILMALKNNNCPAVEWED